MCIEMERKIIDFIIPYGIIYMIRNKVNDKKYIGQTTQTLKERCIWSEDSLNGKYYYNLHLCNSIKKYGIKKFDRKVLDIGFNQEELDRKEEFYIQKYNTMDQDLGYNLKHGGSRGKLSRNSKKKLSQSNTIYPLSKEYLIQEYWLNAYYMINKILNKKQKTLIEIAEKNNCTHQCILYKMKKFKILRRTISEGHILKSMKKDRKKIEKKFYFTREYLIKEYWIDEYHMKNRILNKQQKNMNEIAIEKKCSSITIKRNMLKNKVYIRNKSESNKLKKIKMDVKNNTPIIR